MDLLRLVLEVQPEPLVTEDELLEDCVVEGVGLVVHHPTSGHDFQLTVLDDGLDLLLDLQRLLGPPHGEEGDLGPDELPAGID